MSPALKTENWLLAVGVGALCIGFLLYWFSVNPPRWQTYSVDMLLLLVGFVDVAAGLLIKYRERSRGKQEQRIDEYAREYRENKEHSEEKKE